MKLQQSKNIEALVDNLLKEALQFKSPVDKLLSNFFRNNRQLSSLQRSTIAEKIYTTIRNMPIPQWLYDKLNHQFGSEESSYLIEALKKPAALNLRINLLKTTQDKVLQLLKEIDIHKCKYSPYGLYTYNKTFLTKHSVFLDGLIEVQDESSQLAGLLLNPKRGEMIVDFCAGSGGKTLLFGMLMRNSGRIYAFDINQKRLSNLTPRLVRSGLSNVYPQLIQNENDIKIKRLHNKIDRVFVDAPCSGLGTLRRSPELKFRQTETSISELNNKQLSILTAASKLLKSGGYLVYATCSILEEENSNIINKFLSDNPNFELINANTILNPILVNNQGFLQLFPHIHETDGFFAALMRRNNPNSCK